MRVSSSAAETVSEDITVLMMKNSNTNESCTAGATAGRPTHASSSISSSVEAAELQKPPQGVEVAEVVEEPVASFDPDDVGHVDPDDILEVDNQQPVELPQPEDIYLLAEVEKVEKVVVPKPPPLRVSNHDQSTYVNLAKYFKNASFEMGDVQIKNSELTPKFLEKIVKNGDYWNLGKLLFVLKNFSHSLVKIYLESIEYKLDLDTNQLDLVRVAFPKRNLPET